MKRLVYDSDSHGFVWKDWKQIIKKDFGPSVTDVKQALKDSVVIANATVRAGSSRKPIYTFPDGVDTGLRIYPLFSANGLDRTEVDRQIQILESKRDDTKELLKDELKNQVEILRRQTDSKNLKREDFSSGTSSVSNDK